MEFMIFRGRMAKILFNFLISPTTKQRFESICTSSGRTMSNVLNDLIDTWIIDQAENLEHRSISLQRVDDAIASSHVKPVHLHQPDHDDDPISFFHHDGSDFNDHNF